MKKSKEAIGGAEFQVLDKPIRIDAGLPLNTILRLIDLFDRETEEKRTEGVYLQIGPDSDYLTVWIRETSKNIIVRWVHRVRDGRYVQAGPFGIKYSGTVREGAGD